MKVNVNKIAHKEKPTILKKLRVLKRWVNAYEKYFLGGNRLSKNLTPIQFENMWAINGLLRIGRELVRKFWFMKQLCLNLSQQSKDIFFIISLLFLCVEQRQQQDKPPKTITLESLRTNAAIFRRAGTLA